jgi:outer membrane protein OmpA-like peptidoglycan-associated protein
MKISLRKLADGVRGKKELWLRLMAYANAEGMTASKARRLSLSRALSVRSFLIESGLRSTRIGVMALGNKSPDKPKNRVDIKIAKR